MQVQQWRGAKGGSYEPDTLVKMFPIYGREGGKGKRSNANNQLG